MASGNRVNILGMFDGMPCFPKIFLRSCCKSADLLALNEIE